VGVDLLWTLFSRWVQSLCHRVMTMWMYLGPSCPNRPFYEELGGVKINTSIHRFLAHGVDLNPGARVDSTRVSLFASAFVNLCNLICSWHSRPPVGSCVISQCATGGHIT
jgi:hypothetical protein